MIRLVCAILLATAMGCGSDSGDKSEGIVIGGPDAGNEQSDADQDSGSSVSDSGSSVSDSGTSDAGSTTPGCAFEGFEVSSVTADQGERLVVIAETAGTPNRTLFFRYNSADPMPGVLEFDTSGFVDCTSCLFVQTGCEGETCQETYQAREGSIELLQTSGTFRARIEGLELERVMIDDEGTTTTLGGDGYCIADPVELSAPITVDPCADMPDPVFVDVNCGPAPLTVQFDLTAAAARFDPLYFVEVDFGDGESFSSGGAQTTVSHDYAAGEWEAEIVISGFLVGDSTLNSFEEIRAY